MTGMRLRPIGTVHSPLRDPADAPRQGDEGAPEACIELDPEVVAALEGIAPGDAVIVLTWLDRAGRDELRTRPRSDPAREPVGVFATRSPNRPNPIGLHRVRIVAIDGARVRVHDLEAVDGTPVLDIKPVLKGEINER